MGELGLRTAFTDQKKDMAIPGLTLQRVKTTIGKCFATTFEYITPKPKRRTPMGELTSRDRTVLITEMAKRQDAENRRLRDSIEAFRSIFGRLQAFAEQGWFLIGEEGKQDRWLRAESVLEILRAAETVIDDVPKSDDPPFGINRMGDISIVDGVVKNGRLVAAFPNPLDT